MIMFMYKEEERDPRNGTDETGGGKGAAEGGFRIIAVTNRHLSAGDYFERMEKIVSSGADAVIVREKDLKEREYEELARRVIKICERAQISCILHTYAEAAVRLNCRKIHFPLHVLRVLSRSQETMLRHFSTVGASVHSPEEAREAQALGADYVTAGHVFATDCKRGLEPRGLEFLRETVNAVSIPVFAIGGISAESVKAVRKAGAAGACIMSQMMRGEFYEK